MGLGSERGRLRQSSLSLVHCNPSATRSVLFRVPPLPRCLPLHGLWLFSRGVRTPAPGFRAQGFKHRLQQGQDVFECAIPGFSRRVPLHCLQQQGHRREPGRPTAAQSREWGIVLAHTSLSPADASLASSSNDSAARGPSAGQAGLKLNLHPKRAPLCTRSLIPRSFCTWLLRPPFAVAPGLQDATCANRLCFSRSVSACLFSPLSAAARAELFEDRVPRPSAQGREAASAARRRGEHTAGRPMAGRCDGWRTNARRSTDNGGDGTSRRQLRLLPLRYCFPMSCALRQIPKSWLPAGAGAAAGSGRRTRTPSRVSDSSTAEAQTANRKSFPDL